MCDLRDILDMTDPYWLSTLTDSDLTQSLQHLCRIGTIVLLSHFWDEGTEAQKGNKNSSRNSQEQRNNKWPVLSLQTCAIIRHDHHSVLHSDTPHPSSKWKSVIFVTQTIYFSFLFLFPLVWVLFTGPHPGRWFFAFGSLVWFLTHLNLFSAILCLHWVLQEGAHWF